MKYFFDCEFFEGFHKPLFGKRRHFIDLISIGILCEDGREYHAVSNEFDLKRVWNDAWMKENVLEQLHNDLYSLQGGYAKMYHWKLFEDFNLKCLRNLIRWHGKSNAKIANEIYQFVCPYKLADEYAGVGSITDGAEGYLTTNPPEFYAYYSDYDWVLFCSLFGKMIDLPKGFPMYCIDLKQTMDSMLMKQENKYAGESRIESWLNTCKNHPSYPKQENEHNALSDAKWNYELYKFLQSL